MADRTRARGGSRGVRPAFSLAVGVLFVGIGVVTWLTRHAAPTLGSAHYAQVIGGRAPGFGTAAPRRLDANAGAAGVVDQLRWAEWGAAQAIGRGRGRIAGAQGGSASRLVAARLRAWDLGRCRRGGPVVYRRLARWDGRRWSRWPSRRSLC